MVDADVAVILLLSSFGAGWSVSFVAGSGVGERMPENLLAIFE
jgi:hypothetical protein